MLVCNVDVNNLLFCRYSRTPSVAYELSVLIRDQSLFKSERGWRRKLGGASIFFCRTWGALKGTKGWGGSSLIKTGNCHLPYFGIMFEVGS